MKKKLFRNLILLFGFIMFSIQLPAAIGVPSENPVSTAPGKEAVAPLPSIRELVNSFKEMTRSERKARIKEVKKELKEYKRLKKSGAEPIADRTLIIILAILIPPLGVYLYEGEINSKFWISLLLTLLFFIPGMIYSLLVVTGNA